jgi:xylulokinase
VGIRPAQLSPLQPSGYVIGEITPGVSALTGLPRDTLVVNGGHDQACTVLALGIVQPDEWLLAGGTSWVVTSVVGRPDVPALPAPFDLNAHAAPGCWTVSQSLGGLGASLEWLASQCWQHVPTRAAQFEALNRELAATQPGCEGLLFLPISGGHSAPAGLQRGGFASVQLGHTRAHLARAIMEGAAYELRLALEQADQAGFHTGQLCMVGGATRSAVWPRIVADVTGIRLRVTECAHLPAIGAAMLAGWGARRFSTLAEAPACFGQPAQFITPDAAARTTYEACFERYQRGIRAGI